MGPTIRPGGQAGSLGFQRIGAIMEWYSELVLGFSTLQILFQIGPYRGINRGGGS